MGPWRLPELGQGELILAGGFLVEAAEYDLVQVVPVEVQEGEGFAEGDAAGEAEGEAINAATDGGESDGAQTVFAGETETVSVT